MMFWTEIKIVLIITIMLLIPGWAFLAVSGLWRRFEVLQRWFLAIGISIAFYPILFYTARTILPNLRIGDTKLILMLILMAGVIFWFMRKSWREQFQIGKWGGLILAVLGATLFTRLILAHQYPYPAWTDSLHHTLITNLVAINGRLPYNLLPYSQTNLDQYHLGMYALTGSLQLLADIPAHTALLWMAQALNGLCVIGVFLFLDRKVSRLAGLVGMVVVGLLNFQPAWYFNWGRFTQITSQSILLISALITWETVESWGNEWPGKKKDVLYLTLSSCILIAGVFLTHFKVAGYILPLLSILSIKVFIENIKKKKKTLQTFIGLTLIISISLILVLPALIPAFNVYYQRRTVEPVNSENLEKQSQDSNPYYSTFSFKSLWDIATDQWLALVALCGIILGIWTKKLRSVTLVILIWIIFLILEGYAYLLNIPLLAFTNMTGMMIMLYLPIGLLAGIFVKATMDFFNPVVQGRLQPILIWFLLFGSFIASFDRVNGIEDYRFFMTDADRKAMEWIKQNTAEDAVFAINTHFWLPNSPHGSDGGYWIPYFSERKITTDTMIASLGPEYNVVINRSNAVKSLYKDEPTINDLCKFGVDYIYDGAKETFNDEEFKISRIAMITDVEIVYESEAVYILKICN